MQPPQSSIVPRDDGANRRVHRRIALKMTVACRVLSSADEQFWAAELEDISRGGVLLTIGRRLYPGAVLVVRMPLNDQEPTPTLYVRVVHVRHQWSGYWSVGCTFARPMPEEELQTLIRLTSPFQPGRPELRLLLKEAALETGTDLLATKSFPESAD